MSQIFLFWNLLQEKETRKLLFQCLSVIAWLCIIWAAWRCSKTLGVYDQGWDSRRYWRSEDDLRSDIPRKNELHENFLLGIFEATQCVFWTILDLSLGPFLLSDTSQSFTLSSWNPERKVKAWLVRTPRVADLFEERRQVLEVKNLMNETMRSGSDHNADCSSMVLKLHGNFIFDILELSAFQLCH